MKTFFKGGVFALVCLSASIIINTAQVAAGTVLKQFRSGSLPIQIGAVLTDDKLRAGVLVIRGEVIGKKTSQIAIRIDDANSTNYATRFNMERKLMPGPFRLRVPLKGLKTTHKKPLDINAIRKIIVFATEGSEHIRINHYAVEEAIKLPKGAAGYSFGSEESPLFDGFLRITAQDPGIAGANLREILRPGVDPLLASGIHGVERVTVKAKPGRNRVTLWTEETSAWEALRGFVKRRIRINDKAVLDEEYTPQEWVKNRYMAGRNREVGYDNDIWELYGKHRGGRSTHLVDVGPEGEITIKISGEGPTAHYLSAILVEPEGVNALDDIEQRRKAWFHETWKVYPTPREEVSTDRTIDLDKNNPSNPVELVLTSQNGTSLYIDIRSQNEEKAPIFEIKWDDASFNDKIKTRVWAGQRRLEKIETGGNLFAPRSSLLRSDLARFRLYGNIPRKYAFWMQPKETLPVGIHNGVLSLKSENKTHEIPLRLIVPPIVLPEAKAPSGFYLIHPPHLNWHKSLHKARDQQTICDLYFLKKLGITGNAPALHVPFANGKAPFIRDMQNALQFANAEPWLAYSSSFGLYQQLGIKKGAKAIADTLASLRKENLPAPVWSMADEPSNASIIANDMPLWVDTARKAAPDALFAGHLNNPADRAFVSLFDIAIINQGFGIDRGDIKSLKKQNVSPWIYNTGQPRLTAGLWLWITGADRYIQWHGRLPLGDAFDPTDGREGDVSMFSPMPEICAEQPDINILMLEMAEGIVDQRFFQWLSNQRSAEAIKLATIIRKSFNGRWENATGLPRERLQSLRIAISKLALRLNGIDKE